MAYVERINRDRIDRTKTAANNIWCFDLETKPALAYTYQMYKTNIAQKWLVEPGQIISFSAASYAEPHKVYYSDVRDEDFLDHLWTLIDRASYVITYNGDRFDLPKANGAFASAGMIPPRPPKSIDLFKTVRKMGWDFKSLNHACRMMGIQGKLDNGGASNWYDAIVNNNPEAWKQLRRYNAQDVRATLDLYDVLRPWIKPHPHLGLTADDWKNSTYCPRCGHDEYKDVGAYQANLIRYRQRRCTNCKGIYRTTFHSRTGQSHAL